MATQCFAGNVSFPDGFPLFNLAPNVTQLTNINTAVTNNASRGRITLFGTIATNTSSLFTVTCSSCLSTSTVFVSCNSTPGADHIPLNINVLAQAGSFILYIYNPSANTTATTPVINYVIM